MSNGSSADGLLSQVGTSFTQVESDADLKAAAPPTPAHSQQDTDTEKMLLSTSDDSVFASEDSKELKSLVNIADEEDELTYDYFEDQLIRIMSSGGFRGSVNDYCVFDTSFRKRRSSIESSEIDSECLPSMSEPTSTTRVSTKVRRSSIAVRRSSKNDGEASYVEFFVEPHGSSGIEISLFLLRRFSDFEKFEADLRQALKLDGIGFNTRASSKAGIWIWW